jgi:hypothetical protein
VCTYQESAPMGLSIPVYSQPGRRRGGRADCIPWRSYYPRGGNVRAGRRLSYYNSQAASVPAGLSDVRRREDEAPASDADDVAAAIAEVVRQSKTPYPIYELAGRRVYSYEELLRSIARSAGLRPVLMRMPFAFWDAVAGLAEFLSQPPLTRNQVELMQIDTTASENRPGFRALGISPRSLEEELEAMLKHGKTQTQKTLIPGRD